MTTRTARPTLGQATRTAQGGWDQAACRDHELLARTYVGQGESLVASFSYDLDGRATQQIDYASGTVVATLDTSYDPAGDVTNMHDLTAASTTVNFDYAYDPADQLTVETDNYGTPTTYSYDPSGQLLGAGTTTYTYDANGNQTGAGVTVGVDNELLSDGTYNYTYDAAGNEITKTPIAGGESWTYGYDNENHLISATESSAGTVQVSMTYEYDVYGNRIEMQEVTYTYSGGGGGGGGGGGIGGIGITSIGIGGGGGTGTTSTVKYAIDQWNPGNGPGIGLENSAVWADLNASNGLQTRYIDTDTVDQLIARVDYSGSGTAYWYLLDRQNSTRDVITNSAALADTINYDAYGNIIWETSPTYGGVYKYTGREFDAEMCRAELWSHSLPN